MKKIAEFKQERFAFLTDEKKTIKYEDPTYCVLYQTESKYLLIKHIQDTVIKVFEHYKDASKEFSDFVKIQISNE